ncbi:UDP-2,3-diacylglucosamine diphosphatase, partial [Pseudomonas quasicaspiana]|nr:UDP-2,3-diacylglucosamine diphosphatase [Pseudomonas quasicaspiana]
DDAMSPFQRSICQALRELSDSGTQIFLMHGNRDFMIGMHQKYLGAAIAQLSQGLANRALKGRHCIIANPDLEK